VPGNHLGRNLPYPPRLVSRRHDNCRRRAIIPRVQKSAGCPYPWPVSGLAAFASAQHELSGLAAQREHERVIDVVVSSREQIDAPANHGLFPEPGARGLDA
jgi:hypothetical protein